MGVRFNNNIVQWLKFFLNGIVETAKKGVITFDALLQLQKNIEAKLKHAGSRSLDAMKIVEHMYSHPIININKATALINKSPNTAYKTIGLLEEKSIVKEITGAQRGKLYMFDDYISLFKD